MRCRHRLTVHPDLLSQASRHPGLRVGERDRFRADAALPTPHPTLRIDQRDRMRSPGQIVPRPIARRPHTPGPTTAATAAVAPASSALDPERHSAVNGLAVTLGRHDPEPRQPQNPRTMPLRSHRSSLVVCTAREDGTGWSGVRGTALRTRPPSRPPQERGPRRRPGPSAQMRVLKSTKSPEKRQAAQRRTITASHSIESGASRSNSVGRSRGWSPYGSGASGAGDKLEVIFDKTANGEGIQKVLSMKIL